MQKQMTRREFVKMASVVGGSMLLGASLFNTAFASPLVNVQGFFSTQSLYNGVAIPLYGFNADRAMVDTSAMMIKSTRFPLSSQDRVQIVLEALKAGYKHIEASIKSSDNVGNAFVLSQIPRQDLFLSLHLSKDITTGDEVIEEFNEALSKMKTDYADLVLMEVPQNSKNDVSWLEMATDIWQSLEKLYKQKRVRSIGVANLQDGQFYQFIESCTIKPMINELDINPFNFDYNNKVYIERLHDYKIITSTTTTLGDFVGSIYDPILQKVARKHNKTGSQVALRWGLQSGFITLPSANTIDQVKEYADIFDFSLDVRDMKAISHVHEKKKK